MSCVVLTQVLDHPGVKMYSEDRARGSVEGSVGGRVPDKYVLVRNNELAHIRLVQLVGSGWGPWQTISKLVS